MSSNLTNVIEEAVKETQEIQEKEYAIRKNRVAIQHTELENRLKQQQAFTSLPIGKNIAVRAERLSKENEEYIKLAKNAATFLSMEIFKDKVALFPRNIILIGAETGTGKSTTVANFIVSYLKQNKRCIVLTNEEYPTDILNRVVFLLNNWAYTDHNDITPEQLSECRRCYPLIMQRVEIIDDKFNGLGGTTTTLEGIMSVLNELKRQKDGGENTYDAILIDYIQNIKSSIELPSLAQWQVLDRFGAKVDNWKGLYPAPILFFSQLKSSTNDHEDFKDRIEKFKAVMNHATTAIEVKADRENLRTEWIFRKNRFKGAVGISVFTGYDKGAYVEYSNEFAQKILAKNEAKKHKELLGKALTKGF